MKEDFLEESGAARKVIEDTSDKDLLEFFKNETSLIYRGGLAAEILERILRAHPELMDKK